jgi:tRNA-2-methylthio-N6-dimethylallyladenosine synthase
MEQIPQEFKSERYTRLIALQNELALSINDAYVGKDVIVLCEGPSKGNADLLAGRSEQSKMVFFTPPAGKELPEGTFAQVHITRADPYALYGEFLRDAE